MAGQRLEAMKRILMLGNGGHADAIARRIGLRTASARALPATWWVR